MSTTITRGQSINLSTGEVTDPPQTVDTDALTQWREDDHRTTPLETVYGPQTPHGTIELRGAVDREARRTAEDAVWGNLYPQGGDVLAAFDRDPGWTVLRTPQDVSDYFTGLGTD